ncbi:MAG: AAA family ATPase, partial [Myxococcales bacterium]|nr:AAA family ATPase [Myxococcales bacterium]
MFKREDYLSKIEQHFRVHSVCALLGPRQVGKTTLARTFVQENRKGNARFFDLEKAVDLAR